VIYQFEQKADWSVPMKIGKKTAGIFLTFLFLIVSLTVSAQTAELPHYDLYLRFDPDEGSLSGRATIAFPESAVRDRVVRLNVEIIGDTVMDVAAIHGPGNQPLTFEGPDADGVLLITVGEGALTLTVEYSFAVDTTHLDPFGYYIFAPIGKTSWAYPELERADGTPYHFADFDVSFECPSSLAVLTSGGEGSNRTENGRTVTFAAAANVEAVVIVAGEGFEVRRNEEGGVAVVAFYHPDFEDKFNKVVKHTQEAAVWYRKTYDFFPLDQLCIIQGHPTWAGGYPLPNVFFIHLGNLESEHLVWISAHCTSPSAMGARSLNSGATHRAKATGSRTTSRRCLRITSSVSTCRRVSGASWNSITTRSYDTERRRPASSSSRSCSVKIASWNSRSSC
jgi:hypothetical protein